MKIIFIGTSEFASLILDKIVESDLKPSLIITNPDRPAGRNQELTSPPVKLSAKKHNIKTIQPVKIQDSISEIRSLAPDLIIVISYGQTIPREILNIPKQGCLNVHPSLLPKYRGPSPIQTVILNGEKETGVTIIQMIEKIDAGPIIVNEKLKTKNEKLIYRELHDQLAGLGVSLLIKIIPKWIDGKIKPKPQDELKATYTKIITKKDGKIDWNTSAQEIERKVIAFNSWPGTYAFYEDKKNNREKIIKILDAETQEQTDDGPFGPLGKVYIATNNKLAVQT